MPGARRLALAAAIAAAVLAGAVPAAAGARTPRPARGLYECFGSSPSSGRLYAGGFRLLSATRYRSVGGRLGTYRVLGRRVTFLSGPYRSFTGRTRRTPARRWVVDIVLRTDRSVREHCYRVRR